MGFLKKSVSVKKLKKIEFNIINIKVKFTMEFNTSIDKNEIMKTIIKHYKTEPARGPSFKSLATS
jgi:EAL domain-containing protein (putative c-di-GMP-specific phosphodiesterase class I)